MSASRLNRKTQVIDQMSAERKINIMQDVTFLKHGMTLFRAGYAGTLKKLSETHDRTRTHETILLSPGCVSFDQFKDFEDRGDQFA